MRLLKRNVTTFEYLPYDGVQSDLNDDGEHTGEFHPTYGDPIMLRGNISSPSGRVNQTFYGQDIRYTHTLVMDDPEAEIKEGGLIRWKGNTYDVQAVRPSLNVLSVALKRRTGDDPSLHPVPVVSDEPEEPEGLDGEGE